MRICYDVLHTDKPFTEEFKHGVRKMTRSEVRFGLIPVEHWSYPAWIDLDKAAKARENMQVRTP